MQEQIPADAPEEGRATDTVVGHLTLGEIVLPRDLTDNPEVLQMLQQLFQQAGLDISEFTVGSPNNKINPETGYPEFFSFGKLLKFAAPLALSYFAPGIGTALGSSLLGAGAAGSATLGNALIGGGIGALTGGGLKGAALGAGLGAVGANIGSLGNVGAGGNIATGLGSSGGEGILGAVGKATGLNSGSIPSFGGLTGSAGGGSSFASLGGGISSALGGMANADAIKKAQQDQLRAQQQQLANIGTFDPSNITNDAGYQFNLAEGQKGLDRSAAAAGGLQSGAALKAASKYSQQYADNALNSAYSRWSDKTNAQNTVYGNTGNTNAQYGLAGAENIGRTASGILNPQPSIEELLRLYGRA